MLCVVEIGHLRVRIEHSCWHVDSESCALRSAVLWDLPSRNPPGINCLVALKSDRNYRWVGLLLSYLDNHYMYTVRTTLCATLKDKVYTTNTSRVDKKGSSLVSEIETHFLHNRGYRPRLVASGCRCKRVRRFRKAPGKQRWSEGGGWKEWRHRNAHAPPAPRGSAISAIFVSTF